jgi:hypothetical protein
MKARHEIPAGITKTDFAKLLHGRLMREAKTGVVREVTWQYIFNQLGPWGVWPLK